MSGIIDTSGSFPPGFLEESRGAQIIGGNVSVQIIGTLVFLARVYSRLVFTRNWKSEDWALVSAWLVATAYSICQYVQVAYGSGRHLAAVPRENAVTSQKFAFIAQICAIIAIPLPKVSVCLLYLRIFFSDVPGRRLIYALLVTLAMTIFPFVIQSFLSCKPLRLYWEEFRPADKCLDDSYAIFIHGSVNLAVDIALMGILIPRILKLKLNTRQKSVLVGIVLLGSVAVVAGIVRQVRVGTTLSKYKTGGGQFDPPWDMFDVSIWTSTEIYVTLSCAAAPGLKPLVSKLLPKLLGTTLATRSRTTGGHTYPMELTSKMKRSMLGTSRTEHNSESTTNLTYMPHGPYAEIRSTGRQPDEESLDGKSDVEPTPMKPKDGILRNTIVVIKTVQL